MVARVALAPDTSADISSITHISGLQFQSTMHSATESGRENTNPEDGDRPKLVHESKEPEAEQESTLSMA